MSGLAALVNFLQLLIILTAASLVFYQEVPDQAGTKSKAKLGIGYFVSGHTLLLMKM